MTAAIAASLLGKRAFLSVDGLYVEVYITDVKERWGRTRYQVRPVAGYGTRWVEQLTIPEVKS